VPAFEAEAFVGDCLEAARRQTYDRIAVHVAVDASADATERACREFEADARFRVDARAERLGWVGNVNYLLDRVETEFFFVLPHDDLLEPDYVASLRDSLSAAPEALVAYADVATFGAVLELRSTPGLDGDLVERVLAMLASPTEGVPFRGLTRSWALRRGLRLHDNRHAGFGAHILWVLELLCHGPFVHVPRPLYRRWVRSDPASVVQGWDRRSPAERLAAWIEHSTACLRAVAEVDADAADRLRLVVALLARGLVRGERRNVPGWDIADPSVRRELVLLAALAGPGLGLPAAEPDTLDALPEEDGLWTEIARMRGRRPGDAAAAGVSRG